jgi:hypothetical protein
MTQQKAQQQREDDSVTSDIERRKRDWNEPMFQKEEDPKETERLEKEKEKSQGS